MRGLVKSGGLLVVVSGYQWNHETTPRSLWLGGYVDERTGEEVKSTTTLVQRLSADFDLMEHKNMPILWHESAIDIKGRLYAVSVFQRK